MSLTLDPTSEAAQVRRAALRRMKAFATGLLFVAAAVFVVTYRALANGAPTWVGYLNAAAEAGMIGGLADWFAVTALFRRPLGLPIPHTALIPTKKDQLGAGLSDFVAENFLSEAVVREKLARANLTIRVGQWLGEAANAERVSAGVAAAVGKSFALLDEDELRASVEFTVMSRLATVDPGPPLGKVLAGIVDEGVHHPAVDLLVEAGYRWLADNQDLVVGQVAGQAPTWAPRLVNDMVATKIYTELIRVAGRVRNDPRHPFRQSIDRYLRELSIDLQRNPQTQAQARDLLARLLTQPEIREAFSSMWGSARTMILDLLSDPESQLRLRMRQAVADLGKALITDDELRTRVDGYAQDLVVGMVGAYRGEITGIITETIDSWDGVETAERIELQVGADLQFIRVNGFVVGALAGVVIHGVATLL